MPLFRRSAKKTPPRVEASKETELYHFPGVGLTLKVAYVSQRGYYPDNLNKLNQDSSCLLPNFCQKSHRMFLGVFDGHGEMGTACSKFAQQQIPRLLQKHLLTGKDDTTAHIRAFTETNSQLHKHPIDDSLSGTTAISVYINGADMTVANVGDSRAIIGEYNNGHIISHDLSHDQTPYRPDELVRVRKAGARVQTLDQIEGLKDPDIDCWGTEEGDGGDPPRIWAPYSNAPGTAFTRSIGDFVAEKLGVSAEPEVFERRLDPNCKAIIVASDGVFEFLSSQTVLDMALEYNDPQEAAYAITEESYRQWLQYDTRTDDITIIIAYLEWDKDAKNRDVDVQKSGAIMTNANRPVRRALAKDKRKLIEQEMGRSNDEDDEEDWDELEIVKVPKTKGELECITLAVRATFLFSHLKEEQQQIIYDVMEKVDVKPGETVIKQGERGDYFYIVQTGEYDVFVQHGDNAPHLVHTYTTKSGANPCFGELALLYGKPRAASVVGKTKGILWKLHRRFFRHILQRKDPKVLLQTLRSVEILQSCTIGQLQRLADTMNSTKYMDGDFIIRQGEEGDEFYIIRSGDVVCKIRKEGADPNDPGKEVLKLGANQYFGERALLSNTKRLASVIAVGPVECLHINRKVFEEVLGPLKMIIDADRQWREQTASRKQAVLRRPSVRIMASFALDDLEPIGTIYENPCDALVLMYSTQTKEKYTARMTSTRKATEQKRQNNVMRARKIVRSVPASTFVPSVVKSYKTKNVLVELIYTRAHCTLDDLLQKTGAFNEEAAKFVCASITLAIDHLHKAGVIYRGLSPETIIVTRDGVVQITDFRYAAENSGEYTYTICGDPEFLAPEIVENVGHSESVDWWAFGVMVYFLLTGETPFSGNDELQIYKAITAGEFTFPEGISEEAQDLVRKILVKDPAERLGCTADGLRGIKEHPWFQDFQWQRLIESALPPPEVVKQNLKDIPEPYLYAFPIEPYHGEEWFKDF